MTLVLSSSEQGRGGETLAREMPASLRSTLVTETSWEETFKDMVILEALKVQLLGQEAGGVRVEGNNQGVQKGGGVKVFWASNQNAFYN